jgi:hypothetical protein
LLASGYNPGAVHQSAGFCLSMLLMALVGLIMSFVMLRSSIFSKATAYVGIVASALDLVYLVGLVFMPETDLSFISILHSCCRFTLDGMAFPNRTKTVQTKSNITSQRC